MRGGPFCTIRKLVSSGGGGIAEDDDDDDGGDMDMVSAGPETGDRDGCCEISTYGSISTIKG